jgi:hypothetical protein
MRISDYEFFQSAIRNLQSEIEMREADNGRYYREEGPWQERNSRQQQHW